METRTIVNELVRLSTKSRLVVILCLMGLLSCSRGVNPTAHNSNSDQISDSLMSVDSPRAIQEIWGLTNYFDSICKYKELTRFGLQLPTRISIILKIEGSKVTTIGSIEGRTVDLDLNSDTLAFWDSEVSGIRWFLVQDLPLLRLVRDGDTTMETEYVFRQGDDLKIFADTNGVRQSFESTVSDYFHTHLFEGVYYDRKTKTKVVFTRDGRVSGFMNFNRYNVNCYFGTAHPFRNFDAISFQADSSKLERTFNWRFEGNQLILRSFEHSKEFSDGKQYLTDFYEPGKEQIILEEYQMK